MYKIKKSFLVLSSLLTVFICQSVLAEIIQCPKALDFQTVQPPTRLIVFGKKIEFNAPYLELMDKLKNNWDEAYNTTKGRLFFSSEKYKNGMPEDTQLTISLYSAQGQPYNYQICEYTSPGLQKTTIGAPDSDLIWIKLDAKQLIDHPEELLNKPQWKQEEIYSYGGEYPEPVGFKYVCHTTAAHPENCYQ
jgi:hypothetical protein